LLLIRLRKPCSRLRGIRFGWYVRFGIVLYTPISASAEPSCGIAPGLAGTKRERTRPQPQTQNPLTLTHKEPLRRAPTRLRNGDGSIWRLLTGCQTKHIRCEARVYLVTPGSIDPDWR
jgi:hypothetical protein